MLLVAAAAARRAAGRCIAQNAVIAIALVKLLVGQSGHAGLGGQHGRSSRIVAAQVAEQILEYLGHRTRLAASAVAEEKS